MKTEVQARLPRMLGSLAHANQYLKTFAMTAMIIAVLSLVVAIVGINRPPVVLTLSPNGEVLKRESIPSADSQIRAAVQRYLELRYQWQPSNVKQKLDDAQAFILPTALKAYQSGVGNVARFATEKTVSQSVYPEVIAVNLEMKIVSVRGERITTIQGLKAAGALNLELSFEMGARSEANPWGIYITKEKELQ